MIRFITICASNKAKIPCKAINLYKGAYFNVVREIYKLVDFTYILSAKNGLVYSEDIFEPYDVSFSPISGTIPPNHKEYWDNNYPNQISNFINQNPQDIFIIYLSDPYLKAVQNDIEKCIQNENVYLFCSKTSIKEFRPYCIKPKFGKEGVGGNRISLCASSIKYWLNNINEIGWDKNNIRNFFEN